MIKFTQSTVKRVCLVLGVALACASCSLVFSSGATEHDAGVEQDAAIELDARVRPTALITVIEPGCEDNIYRVQGIDSTSADGTSLAGYRWEIKQNGKERVTFDGEGTVPVEPTANVLSGTMSQFDLRPSLFSAPNVMHVTGAAPTPATNQVFQRNLVIAADQSYEVSFVASSFVTSSFSVRMIVDDTGTNLGLLTNANTTNARDTFTFPFTATRSSSNARLQMVFDSPGSFFLDNFSLRSPPIGGINQINNSEIEGNLDNWPFNFSSGTLTLADMPRDFPETVITLKVVDSSNRESVAVSTTISSPDCN